MKFLLLEPKVKAIAPNLALMKWARWCENNSHEYRYVRGIVDLGTFEPDEILMSCIFSFFSKRYEIEIDHYLQAYTRTKFTIGGVFPSINPEWFEKPKWGKFKTFGFLFGDTHLNIHKGLHCDIDTLAPKYDLEIEWEDEKPPYPNDKIILYSSRGCVNKCAYCAVPRLEPDHVSFKSIKYMLDATKKCSDQEDCKTCEYTDCFYHKSTGVFIYDNNFTEHKYSKDIVKELVEFGKPVDFRQGLHVDAFTQEHARQFKDLEWLGQGENGTAYIRFSFDKMEYAEHIERALGYINEADRNRPDRSKLPEVFCYMLFNFNDSPDDFWKRIELAQGIVDRQKRSIFLFPMKYEPYDAEKRNTYTGKKWKTYDKNGKHNKWVKYLDGGIDSNGKPLRQILDEIEPSKAEFVLVKGLVKLITYVGHGFIPVTQSDNLYKWIGCTKEKLIQRAFRMATDEEFNKNLKKYKLESVTKPGE